MKNTQDMSREELEQLASSMGITSTRVLYLDTEDLRKELARRTQMAKVETVVTGELQEGDLVIVHGHILRLAEVKLSAMHSEAHHASHGGVHYAKGYSVHGLDLGGIYGTSQPDEWVSKWLRCDGYWQVQGNDLATWLRLTL